MVEISGDPGHRRVTVVAIIAAGDMRRVFANRRNAIVTGIAGTGDLCVIDRVNGDPDVGRMAVFADICGLNMGRILTGRVGAIVTAGTIARDVYVVKIRR